MPRTKLPLIVLAAALLTAALFPPAASASRYRVGIGEQRPELFSQSHFLDTGIKRVRYLVPWNWNRVSWVRGEVTHYINAAESADKDVFVTFTAARGCWTGSYSRAKRCRAPSPRKYRRSFKAFRKAYPSVRTFAPWNEVNHKSQPTYRRPKRAAQYYNVLRRACRKCTIVAADLLDSSNAVRYLRKFRRHAKGKPRRWGLHNYADVNRKRSRGTRAILRAVRGQVWLTETGGIVKFSPDFPYSTRRAASRTRYMFRLARKYSRRRSGMRSRITRIYPYSYFGDERGARFDAGLTNANGTPRAAFRVFRRAVRRLSK